MVRIERQVSALSPEEPPRSERVVLARLSVCPQADLFEHLQELDGQRWERCTAVHWHPVLNRFDDVLAAYAEPQKQQDEASGGAGCEDDAHPASRFCNEGCEDDAHPASRLCNEGAPEGRVVREVLRVLHEVLFHYPELKGAFASSDRLWSLLECSDLLIVLGALQCLSVGAAGWQLRGTIGVAAERRLESLAGCAACPGGLRASCLPDVPAKDFLFEVPRLSGDCRGLSALTVPVASAHQDPEALMRELLETQDVPEAYHRSLNLALSTWCHSRSLEGRREVVAISLYALCNAVKYFGPGFLHPHLQKRPGLFAELRDLMQGLQVVGHEAGIATLRAIGAILESNFGPNRPEMIQLSEMLELSVPHGIVACALRELLSESTPQDSMGNHYKLLVAALDFFQITTASNHQTTLQLGHAGMIRAMLDLMHETDLVSLPAVVAMLQCLELAVKLSGATALVHLGDFYGLQAFLSRLQQEVDFLLALEFQGDLYDVNPPGTDAPEADRVHFWRLLEETTARRRLCGQLLENIQVALRCSDAGRTNLVRIFQGPLMKVLKKALQEPQKVGHCFIGTATGMVSDLIQEVPNQQNDGLVRSRRSSTSSTRSIEDLSQVDTNFSAPSSWVLGGGTVLAMCAGFVDAATYLSLGAFPTHVTGTTAKLGMRVEGVLMSERHTPIELRQATLLVFSFLTGAFLCGLLISKNEVHFGASLYGAALLGNAALLITAILVADLCVGYLGQKFAYELATFCAAAASGLQNGMATMHFGAVVRTTHVTGLVTDLGLTLGRMAAIFTKSCTTKSSLDELDAAEVSIDMKRLRVFGCLGLGFLSGVIIGAYIEHFLGRHALLVPASITGSGGLAYVVFTRCLRKRFKSSQADKLNNDVEEVDRILERQTSYVRDMHGEGAACELDGQMSHTLDILHGVEVTGHDVYKSNSPESGISV